MYKAVKVSKGRNGFGGPLVIQPTEKRNKIVCITGGGIDGVAYRIAELTGAEAVDGFSKGIPDDETACVIVDCGGVARCGVYPKKRIPTVNLTPVGAAGPLAKYILEDIYVSDVKEDNVALAEEADLAYIITPGTASEGKGNAPESKAPAQSASGSSSNASSNGNGERQKDGIITRIGKAVGGVTAKFYQAGRDTIDMVIRNILPFMAFVAMLIGIIQGSGLGDWIAKTISPAANSFIGLLIISIVCAIPVISPIIGPGAVIAQVVGVLVGTEIGKGNIAPSLALPALFAIDAQVGADFVPVGLSLGEAEPETIDAGVPAVLFSRLITGPVAVIIAYIFSIGLY